MTKRQTLCKRKGIKGLAMLFLVMLFIPTSLFSQGRRITLKVTDMPAREVVEIIQDQTSYYFIYDIQEVNLNFNVTLDKKGIDVRDLLNEIFSGRDVNYKIVDNQIHLSSYQAVTTPDGTPLQTGIRPVISGRVYSDTGEPVSWCTVAVKGTSRGTYTDEEGFFEIILDETGQTLVFSYMGMNTVEIRPTSSKLAVKLYPSTSTLDQVVVTGYQTYSKFASTGAVSTLTEKDIDLRSVNSMERLLEGAIPGLTVYNNEYRIRGGSSLHSGTKPLFIVDDFEVETLPENMDMIESITVLKDAAAAAIWGSRAANGVIVITTKRGKEGAPKVSYANNFRFASKPNLNDLYRANAAEQISYERAAMDNDMFFDGLWEGRSGYSQSLGAMRDFFAGRITEAEMDSKLDHLSTLSNRDQIKEHLLRSSFNQNHLVSISGASDKLNYYLSGSYNGGHSSYVGDRNETFNVNSRTSYQLTNFLKFRADINAVFGHNDHGYSNIASNVIDLNPYQMIKDEAGNLVYDYNHFNKEASDYFESVGLYNQGRNILNEVDLASNKTKTSAYKVRFGTDINIIKGLNATIDFQKERIVGENKNILAKESSSIAELINRLAIIDTDNNSLIYNIPNGDILDSRTTVTDAWIFKTGLSFNRTFGSNNQHYINAVAGYEMRKRVMTTERRRKHGYNDQLLSWEPIDEVALSKTGVQGYFGTERYYATSYNGFTHYDNREVSTFASGIYTYDNRYTASASFRYDDSNLFGADKKFRRNPIYSFGANWNISNENFFNSSVVNNLILRATYGLTGNFDRSGSTTPVMVGNRMFLSSVNGFITRITTPPNPLLRWEKTQNKNVSLEADLWGRLHTTVDFYWNYSKDLLGSQILDPTTGYSSTRLNAANMKNRGVEVLLSGHIIKTRDFLWDATWIWAYNKNKITNNKISDGAPEINRVMGTTQFVEGYPREALWSYKSAPFDEFGNPMVYGADDEIVGRAVLESLINTGTYQPKYNGSFSTGFNYKAMTLNFMFVYNFGHKFRMEYPRMNPFEESGNLNKLVADRWTPENTDTDIPAMVSWEHFSDGRDRAAIYSDRSIRSADFIRLREILFNYELPMAWAKKLEMSRISLTAQANTLWLWTANKEKLDPEAVDPIRGAFSFREPKNVTFGIKLEF